MSEGKAFVDSISDGEPKPKPAPKPKRRRPEAEFTKEIQDAVKYVFDVDSFIRKIPDAPRANLGEFCTNCREKIDRMLRFTPRRPFDLFAVVNKAAYMIEVKHHGGKNAWSLFSVTEKQYKALCDSHIAGAYAFVLLYVSSIETAFWLPAFYLQRQIDLGKKSIKIDDLAEHGVPMVKNKILGKSPRSKGRTLWDVRVAMGSEGAVLCEQGEFDYANH